MSKKWAYLLLLGVVGASGLATPSVFAQPRPQAGPAPPPNPRDPTLFLLIPELDIAVSDKPAGVRVETVGANSPLAKVHEFRRGSWSLLTTFVESGDIIVAENNKPLGGAEDFAKRVAAIGNDWLMIRVIDKNTGTHRWFAVFL